MTINEGIRTEGRSYYNYTQSYNRDLFFDNLGKFVFATDDYEVGQSKYLREQGINKAYITPNTQNRVWAMVFDIDKPDATVQWSETMMPEPNWICKNLKKNNTRAHYGYALKVPISRSSNSLWRVQRKFARLEHALTIGLKADISFSHRLIKTPSHPRWDTFYGREEGYDFDELAGYFETNLPLVRRPDLVVGEGRNCSLFSSLRGWAYRACSQYNNYEDWLRACYDMGRDYNRMFNSPLPLSEVRGTCRSVAKWVWERFSASEFSKIQSLRGKRSVVKRTANIIKMNNKKLEDKFDRLVRILSEEEIIC